MKKLFLSPIAVIALCAVLLLVASVAISGISARNAERELLQKMQTILPDSTTFTQETYTGDDANIHRVWAGETGFVVETVTAGYAGEITMLVGVSKDGHVTGLQVRDMQETLGLGANALTDWHFLVQFLNTSADADVGTNVDAITGATVTSRAIARSVNSAVGYVTGADTSSGATSWGG